MKLAIAQSAIAFGVGVEAGKLMCEPANDAFDRLTNYASERRRRCVADEAAGFTG
jgi:hypothetical protein